MADELRKGPSGPPADGVTAESVNDAIVAGEITATAGDAGYVSRRVFANSASTAIGGTYAGETIQAAPTSWTSASQIPPGNVFVIDVFGAGGSGASGDTIENGTDNIPGGAGGGGAAHNQARFSRQELIAALPISFTIPVGPAGGAGVVSTDDGVRVDGNVGAAGGQCSFGTLLTAFGGGGGGAAVGAATSVGGGGGGIHSAGTGAATTTAAQSGGNPLGAASQNSGWGGGGSPATASAQGFASVWGGGGGGVGTANQGNGGIGGDSTYGCGGGAAGPCRNSTVAGATRNGSSGGVSNFPLNTTRAAGSAGVDGTGPQTSLAGEAGATGTYPFGGNGGASSGQARSGTNGSTANSGAGGAGGFPGGGGGGSGPAIMGVDAGFRTGTATSGPGGKGGDGGIVITGYY